MTAAAVDNGHFVRIAVIWRPEMLRGPPKSASANLVGLISGMLNVRFGPFVSLGI